MQDKYKRPTAIQSVEAELYDIKKDFPHIKELSMLLSARDLQSLFSHVRGELLTHRSANHRARRYIVKNISDGSMFVTFKWIKNIKVHFKRDANAPSGLVSDFFKKTYPAKIAI